jgi:hypothetical protein
MDTSPLRFNRSGVDNEHRFGQSPLPGVRKHPFRSRRSRRSRSFPALWFILLSPDTSAPRNEIEDAFFTCPV